jgi:site-specific DNA-methyltransferase (adenine-specific)
MSKERIGYPTQKPEALLERIIRASSNEGDVVLDPFMGGGTTIAVADRLKRQWLGVDQSPMAVKVTELRLQKQKCFAEKTPEKVLPKQIF